MRPRRIARRVVARLSNWGKAHVHCPACGSDHPVPTDDEWHTCRVCGARYFRLDGATVLPEVIDERVGGQRWVRVQNPLQVDNPDGAGGLRGTTLVGSSLVYVPSGPMEPLG